MKVHIRLTDESGTVFEGEVELAPRSSPRKTQGRAKSIVKAERAASKTTGAKLDFTKPERAFVKQYAKGLSGPKRFVLVLAYLAKGMSGKEIPLADIAQRWNRMTSRLSTFNRKFTNDAKENGWVTTSKNGVYVLTPSWKEALS